MKIILFLHSLMCQSKDLTAKVGSISSRLKTLMACLIVIISTVIASCSNDIIIKEKLETLYSSPVVFPNSSMLHVNHHASINNKEGSVKAKYKLLVYNGVGECSTCAMGKMSEWNAFLNLEKEGLINLVFIFSPSKTEKDELITAYYSSGLEHSILIDTCGVFPRQNPQIPQEEIFHTLMLDSAGNVVLVGNPLRNGKIKELYYKILKTK